MDSPAAACLGIQLFPPETPCSEARVLLSPIKFWPRHFPAPRLRASYPLFLFPFCEKRGLSARLMG